MLNFGSVEARVRYPRAAGYIGRGAVLCWPGGYFHGQVPFVALGTAVALVGVAGTGN